MTHELNAQHLTAAKNHWGRWFDTIYFSILAFVLRWDDDAATNFPTVFSSKR
jgi:hypothetical protein